MKIIGLIKTYSSDIPKKTLIENEFIKIYITRLNKGTDQDEKIVLDNFKDVIEKMKRQIRINTGRHNATMHYLKNYGYIPLWILVKVLSFGMVCELYSIMTDEDKLEVSSVFNLTVEQLEDFLPILSNYRNLCAHEDIVFDHKTERKIPDTEYHKKLGIFKMDDEYIH